MDTNISAHILLKEDDFVVVLGSTLTDQGTEKFHRVLARVVGVGEKDIFATAEGSGRIFRIPAGRCIKLPAEKKSLLNELLIPQIGDLVLSIQSRFSSTTEKKMGLLVEIIDIPGKHMVGKLLKGETTEAVPFDSLIVVESASRR